jgi:hypothetical protein
MGSLILILKLRILGFVSINDLSDAVLMLTGTSRGVIGSRASSIFIWSSFPPRLTYEDLVKSMDEGFDTNDELRELPMSPCRYVTNSFVLPLSLTNSRCAILLA